MVPEKITAIVDSAAEGPMKIAALATAGSEGPRVRYMATLVDDDLTVWMAAFAGSDKIAEIEAKLAATTDAAEVARLQTMLDKLEVILAKLQAS